MMSLQQQQQMAGGSNRIVAVDVENKEFDQEGENNQV